MKKLYAEQSEAKKILNLNYEIWSNMNEKVCRAKRGSKKNTEQLKEGLKSSILGPQNLGSGGPGPLGPPPGSASAVKLLKQNRTDQAQNTDFICGCTLFYFIGCMSSSPYGCSFSEAPLVAWLTQVISCIPSSLNS